MAQASQKKPISPELYQATLEQLNLQAVCLDEIRACSDREVAQDRPVEINLSTESESRQTETQFFAFITYRLRGKRGADMLLEIDARFRLVFDAPDPVPNGFCEVFQDLNLRFTTLPYFRELVASMTGRMEIPTLTLPYAIYAGPAEHVEEDEPVKTAAEMTKKRTRKPQTAKT